VRRTALLLAGLALALPAALAGCGLGTAGGYVPSARLAGPLDDVKSLDGAEVSVGSKNFSESVLLGKMALILLKADGAEVTDLTNIPGSASARQAALDGQIDLQWEYTGTGWITYLGHDKPIKDEQRQYEAVRDEDLEENDLVWLPPAPMNNTYGFAVTKQVQEKYGVQSLSDIKDVPVADRTFCIESEFANRPDGLNGMLKTYGVPRGSAQGVPEKNLQIYQTGAIYDATAKGRCNFGEVFTTDGRIVALDLQVLKDDKRYFPNYNVSVVAGKDLMDEYPAIADLVAPVTEKLTNDVLLDLNAQIDVEGREPADVAHDWLADEGFIT
jgi:osmoprotectant transport system substrate-binding protein